MSQSDFLHFPPTPPSPTPRSQASSTTSCEQEYLNNFLFKMDNTSIPYDYSFIDPILFPGEALHSSEPYLDTHYTTNPFPAYVTVSSAGTCVDPLTINPGVNHTPSSDDHASRNNHTTDSSNAVGSKTSSTQYLRSPLILKRKLDSSPTPSQLKTPHFLNAPPPPKRARLDISKDASPLNQARPIARARATSQLVTPAISRTSSTRRPTTATGTTTDSKHVPGTTSGVKPSTTCSTLWHHEYLKVSKQLEALQEHLQNIQKDNQQLKLENNTLRGNLNWALGLNHWLPQILQDVQGAQIQIQTGSSATSIDQPAVYMTPSAVDSYAIAPSPVNPYASYSTPDKPPPESKPAFDPMERVLPPMPDPQPMIYQAVPFQPMQAYAHPYQANPHMYHTNPMARSNQHVPQMTSHTTVTGAYTYSTDNPPQPSSHAANASAATRKRGHHQLA